MEQVKSAVVAGLAVGFIAYQMEVSKTNDKTKKREAIGNVEIYVPTLEALEGLTGLERELNADKTEVKTDDGLPVYKNIVHNWLQATIFNQVKNQTRNKLKPQSLEFKSSQSTVAKDWADLTAESTNTGEGLAILREVKALFGAWVKTLGKTPKTQEQLLALFSSKDALGTQAAEVKAKMLSYVSDFSDTLSAEQATRYENYLTVLAEICEDTTTADDF